MRPEHVRRVLGRKRTLEILTYLTDSGFQNYSDIEDAIDTSSDTLTDSLSLLIEYGLVERKEESRRNVQYRTTDVGDQFLDTVRELERSLQERAD